MNPWPTQPPILPPGFPPIPSYAAQPPHLPQSQAGAPVIALQIPTAANVQAASQWIAHAKPDGKVYYYNKVTQQSTWEKPDELKTPLEKALAACPWKEYKTEDGRKYYSNSVTKETVWKVPAEYQSIIDSHEIVVPIPLPELPPAPVASVVSSAQVNFDTREKAEAAFKEMLETSGVGVDWTWEQTMRHVINKPLYRCLKSLSERKVAFQEYVEEKKRKDKETKETRLNLERDAIFGLLAELGPDLNSMLRYKKFSERFALDDVFLSIDEKRRIELFDEFMTEFRRKETEEKRQLRKDNIERFKNILKTTPSIDVTTTWTEAQNLWASHPDFLPPSPGSVNPLHSMEPIDILVTFEDHMKQLEQSFYDSFDKTKSVERRTERKNRDAFRSLLDKLVSDGIIHFKSKWKEVYPYIKDDPAFDSILGQPGSTPLQLFWDLLIALEDRFLIARKDILDCVRAAGINVTTQSIFEDFERDIRRSSRSRSNIDRETVKAVFDELMSRAQSKQKEEDNRRKEKKSKKRMDAFKSLLKHLNSPAKIVSTDTWEKVRSFVKGTEEYADLDEDQRVYVFEKFIRRLKEKEKAKENESDSSNSEDEGDRSSKKRKSSTRDREKDRDREREQNHSAIRDDDKRYKKRKPSEEGYEVSDRHSRVLSLDYSDDPANSGDKEDGEL